MASEDPGIRGLQDQWDRLGLAKTDRDVQREGFRLIAVAILVSADYNRTDKLPKEEQ